MRQIWWTLCVLLVVSVVPASAQTPLSYEERGQLARSEAWIDRVQMATTATAVAAVSGDPEAPGFARRVALAKYFLARQEVIARRVAWLVLVSDEVTPEITDDALTALVTQQWPAFAAVLVP
jgi:hypothetical protein